jgi:hypothetical protein
MKWLVVIISALFCLACAGSANGNTTNESVTYTFIQEGTSGSFVNDSSGNYTLTITGVIPYTVGFSDRPARNADFVKMEAFLAGFSFDPKNPPNAAVIIQGAKEDEDMIIVELTSPKYNATNQTLTYTAKLTKDFVFESNWANDLVSKADKAIPEKFGKVSIVIDDCPCMYDGAGCDSHYHDSCWYYVGCNTVNCGSCC